MVFFFLEQKDLAFSRTISPAIRYNLFIFKEKIKRIFTTIGAKMVHIISIGCFKNNLKFKIHNLK